ncbi:MAG TPA: hypothetical protein VJS91_00385 [Nitrososphaeraceae archaeon]|nr:hypothetical protein [Nitrososphaeraceae archaeon]
MPKSKRRNERLSGNTKMNLVGRVSTCNICGKQKIIATQRNKVLNGRIEVDVYLECKDCAAIPLWDRKTKEKKQKVFDYYQ